MSKEKQSGGIGFLELLTIAFIVLKLCAVIDWSWWWVLSPTLIRLGFALIWFLNEDREYKQKYPEKKENNQ